MIPPQIVKGTSEEPGREGRARFSRIFLVDDHTIVREGLRALIEAQPDMQVIGEAEDGNTAWKRINEQPPDLVLTDLAMPQGNGL